MAVESPKFEGDPALKVWEAIGDRQMVDIEIALATGMSLAQTGETLADLHLAGRITSTIEDSGTVYWGRT